MVTQAFLFKEQTPDAPSVTGCLLSTYCVPRGLRPWSAIWEGGWSQPSQMMLLRDVLPSPAQTAQHEQIGAE